MNLSLILLGAGTGSRMGGGKLMREVEGKPMGLHALELFAGLPFARRIYVTCPDQDALREKAGELGYSVVINRAPERGIASSIMLGMQILVMQGGLLDTGVLFAVSDQPYLTEGSVRRLMDAFAAADDRICALSAGGETGNPVIFPGSLFTELMKLKGDTGGRQVMRAHPEMILPVEAADAKELKDIDTEEDL